MRAPFSYFHLETAPVSLELPNSATSCTEYTLLVALSKTVKVMLSPVSSIL